MTQISYASLSEIERIRTSKCPSEDRLAILADVYRINTLFMIAKCGSGHIGTSFSCMDILTMLWEDILVAPNETEIIDSDIFFSSKGHDVPALYAVMLGHRRLDFDNIHKLRRLGGLPGHPNVGTPGIITNTGSLGMGISKARGMILARRLQGKQGRAFVLTGDGELQEGQFWESLQPTVNGKFGELTVIVDHNKIQSDTFVSEVSDLGDLEAKFKAFGWEVARCDGHDLYALRKILSDFESVKDKPKIIIADTIKGKGVSRFCKISDTEFGPMYKYHSGAPTAEEYSAALEELGARVNAAMEKCGLGSLELISEDLPERTAPKDPQKLIKAYGEELLALGGERSDLMVFDADLALDCGLLSFRKTYPERFVECGIAEQDMVSSAGGAARMGMLPVVHSFACFLAPRPNEQIYNNASEHSKIIYAGSLAGILPGGPGHSHQSVRDIDILAGTPGMTLIQPCDEQETRMALRWAVQNNLESTYIRLVSIPCEIPYTLPKNYALEKGKGAILRKGDGKCIIFAYGPVMLTQVWKAAELLADSCGMDVTVVNMPWLNYVDKTWLRENIAGVELMVTVDDHYRKGGQGEMLAAVLAECAGDLHHAPRVFRIGLEEIPRCGQNPEVLAHHKLDAQSLAGRIAAAR